MAWMLYKCLEESIISSNKRIYQGDIFTVQNLIEKKTVRKFVSFLVFRDLQKSYDTVLQSNLFAKYEQ